MPPAHDKDLGGGVKPGQELVFFLKFRYLAQRTAQEGGPLLKDLREAPLGVPCEGLVF